MIEKLKFDFKAASEQTQMERVAAFDLEDKPITKALLLRAADYQDEAIRLARQLGNSQPIAQETSLGDLAAGCASSIANKVTIEALVALGRPVFFPHEPLPKYAPMVVAFGLFVAVSICSHLKAERIELELEKVASRTAGLFFVNHPDDERIEHAKRGIAAFQTIAESDASNVQEWQETLSKLVPMYLLQWTMSKDELKKIDFIKPFASQLASLLKVIE